MPLYEYICKDCGFQFDKLRSMKDADSPMNCDHCHSTNTHRLISVFFAQSDGKAITKKQGCSGCGGGSCSSCNN